MSVPFRDLERWEELVADDALVGLSDEDRRVLATLELEGDDLLTQETALYERAAGEVAAAAFAQTNGDAELGRMPSHVTTRLEALFAREAPKAKLEPASKPKPEERVAAPRTAPRRSFAPWALAAAAIVLAVVGWTREPPNSIATQPTVDAGPSVATERARLLALGATARIDFTPTKDPAAQRASGDVVWHSGFQRGYMRIAGLAPNDPTQAQYQLWIFDADREDAFPVDGGVFDVNAAGEALVPFNAKLAVGKAKLFAITVEKAGGVVVSKRERIVLTAAISS